MKKVKFVEEIAFGDLIIGFEENQLEFVIDKILGYLNIFDLPYMYFFGGYREYTEDIEKYFTSYPRLKDEHGMIQIKDQDKKNTKLISQILNEYQISALYINADSNILDDFNKNYLSRKWFIDYKYGGYVIVKEEGNTIILLKDQFLPDWDLQKLKSLLS